MTGWPPSATNSTTASTFTEAKTFTRTRRESGHARCAAAIPIVFNRVPLHNTAAASDSVLLLETSARSHRHRHAITTPRSTTPISRARHVARPNEANAYRTKPTAPATYKTNPLTVDIPPAPPYRTNPTRIPNEANLTLSQPAAARLSRSPAAETPRPHNSAPAAKAAPDESSFPL